MTVKYHLCGYDRRTEFLGVDFDIRPEMLSVVRELLPEAADDPEFFDPLPITDSEAVRVADVLGVPVELDRFVNYFESDEDAYVVAAQVEAMRARS